MFQLNDSCDAFASNPHTMRTFNAEVTIGFVHIKANYIYAHDVVSDIQRIELFNYECRAI